MTREELMSFISLMDYSVSQVNPSGFVVDGYGNYDIRVHGAWGSGLANTSVLNLYFLDSGDRVMVSGVRTYGWIRDSQLTWLHTISEELQVAVIYENLSLMFKFISEDVARLHALRPLLDPQPSLSLSFFSSDIRQKPAFVILLLYIRKIWTHLVSTQARNC